jgi:hypothetical protein
VQMHPAQRRIIIIIIITEPLKAQVAMCTRHCQLSFAAQRSPQSGWFWTFWRGGRQCCHACSSCWQWGWNFPMSALHESFLHASARVPDCGTCLGNCCGLPTRQDLVSNTVTCSDTSLSVPSILLLITFLTAFSPLLAACVDRAFDIEVCSDVWLCARGSAIACTHDHREPHM